MPECKFTPLGFETFESMRFWAKKCGVNLPRWGLKLRGEVLAVGGGKECKFTPLGFETILFKIV